MEREVGRSGPGGSRRLALISFGLALVLLFVLIAARVGLGDSAPVPSGMVAIVEGAPDGSVTEAEFHQSLRQQAAFAGLKAAPEPGDEEYERLKEAALSELLIAAWLRGEAEAMGIEAGREQIAAALRKSGEEESLRETGFTPATMRERTEWMLLRDLIEAQLREEAPEPTMRELRLYYEQERDTAFTVEEKRDVRVVAVEDLSEAEAARRALERDSSPASWAEVAARYSLDPATRFSGGLQQGMREDALLPDLRSPIFDADVGELVGPIGVGHAFFVIEVSRVEPAKTKSFAEVRSQIEEDMATQKQQEFFGAWDIEFYPDWEARTFCADGFVLDQCANHVPLARPAAAGPCFESDPEEPPEGCAAIVLLTRPALPGTVTELNPKGERLPQRPLPEVAEGPGSEIAPGGSWIEALPPGV